MEGLFNDQVDEVPEKADAKLFVGMDAATPASELAPGMIRKGENMWVDVDRLLQTRPAFKFNTLLNTSPGAGPSYRVQGAAYYDIPGFERILAVREGKLYEVVSADDNATNAHVTGPTPSASADISFAQLVATMLWTDGTLRFSFYSAGWTHGTVTTFSDASAMPTWSKLVAHGFRALALDPLTDKIYASAVGQASAAADWVKTENIRVGDGTGDPTLEMISGQNGLLIIVKEKSAWWVNTSAASVANWTSGRITGLTGCVEGKTAVQMGQDIYFLSREGVVSLGQLPNTDSISPADTLSAPMQPYIDRINWAAIGTAWGAPWRSLYVLALPVDSDTYPSLFLCYNTRLKAWATPWKCTLPNQSLGAGTATFAGWSAGVVTRFGKKQETLIGDTCGRLVRLDSTATKDESAAAASQEIVSWGTLRAFDFAHPDHLKQPFWLALEFFMSTANNVQINLVRDGLKAYPDKSLVDCEIIATGLRTNNLTSFPIIFPLIFQPNEAYLKNFHIREFDRFREAGIQFVSQAGRLRLRSLRMQAFIDTPLLNT
jgi:hypothetical protein